MSLKEMMTGLGSSVIANREPSSYNETTNGNAAGGLPGAALSSLGGSQLIEQLNSVTVFLSPEVKANLVNAALNKIGASGMDVKSLLIQLGISPDIAENPHEASPDDLALLSEHLQNNQEVTASYAQPAEPSVDLSVTNERQAEENTDNQAMTDEETDTEDATADNDETDCSAERNKEN